VNQLVIMPTSKSASKLSCASHGIVGVPGRGVGTAEEILYLLGRAARPAMPDNRSKVVLTGPKAHRDYFVQIRRFIEGNHRQKAANCCT